MSSRFGAERSCNNSSTCERTPIISAVLNTRGGRFSLGSVVCAQTTEPSENLPPRVLRTAEMIGVRSQVEELLQLRSAPKRDDIRELRSEERRVGKESGCGWGTRR